MNSDTGNRNEHTGKRKNKRIKKVIKKKEEKKGLILKLASVLASAVFIAGLLIYFLVIREPGEEPGQEVEELTAELIEDIWEEEPLDEIGAGIIDHIVTAESAVDEAYKSRPKTYELTESNRASFAQIESCLIDSSSGKVVVTAQSDGIPASDDKYYYLFALNTYDTDITEDNEYITREYKDTTTVMEAALNYNRGNSRLFKKFALAVKKDGKYILVSTPHYITNPEAIAKYSSVYQQPASKKGLLVDPNKLRGNELDDLGVKQAAYNIPVEDSWVLLPIVLILPFNILTTEGLMHSTDRLWQNMILFLVH